MKKLLLTMFAAGSILTGFAQNAGLVVFSQAGEKFTLTINGERKNDVPQTRVEVQNLAGGAAYQATVVLENVAGGTISKAIYPQPNIEAQMMVKLNKKGKYVLRYAGEKPYTGASEVANSTNTSSGTNGSVPPAPVTNNGNTTTTTTTSTTTSSQGNGNGNGDSFSMNVNVNDETGNASFSMNVRDAGMNMNSNVNVTESSSYTETRTTTTTNENSNYNTRNNDTYNNTSNNGTYSNGRCDYPMDPTDFHSAKSSITSKTFDDSKRTLAKQIIKANCPTADQVKGFVKLMDYESSRLEIAKFAYDYCYDIGNYYKVNDAFEFESTIDELNEYVESK